MKRTLHAVQALALVVLFVILVLVATSDDAKAVIGPSNPTFGVPLQPFNPPPINQPGIVTLPPGTLTPPQPVVGGGTSGGGETAESRERANYLQYRRQIWDLAFNLSGQSGIPTSDIVGMLDNHTEPPPYTKKPNRPPIPGTAKPGQWPTCWVNNPPPPPRPYPSLLNPEIVSTVFAQRCDGIVWELGVYACIQARPRAGSEKEAINKPFRLTHCAADRVYGKDRITLHLADGVCRLRRESPWEWRIEGYVWVDYSPLPVDGFYRSLTYASAYVPLPMKPC